MKRAMLSLMGLVICSLAGHASATVYTLDGYLASQFRQVSISPGDAGFLSLVIDHDGTDYWHSSIFNPGAYGGTMQGQVGFIGFLADMDASGFASMRIGAPITPGTYDGFRTYLANDDQSAWEYRLYVSDGTTVVTGSSWTALVPGTSTTLALPFPTMMVREVGFEVQADYALADAPSRTDAFKTSVVPVPGALGLVLFGLGVGLRWRRYVRHDLGGGKQRVV